MEDNYHKEKGPKVQENNVYFMDFPSVQEKKLLTDQNARVLLRDFSDRQCRDFAQESTSMMILIYCLFSASSNPIARDIARALRESYSAVSLKFGVSVEFIKRQGEGK